MVDESELVESCGRKVMALCWAAETGCGWTCPPACRADTNHDEPSALGQVTNMSADFILPSQPSP